MSETSQTLHEEIAVALPAMIRRAAASYTQHSEKPAPEDSREFGAFQSACKAALAHLDALLRLQRTLEDRIKARAEEAEGPADAAPVEGGELTAMVRAARSGVHRLQEDP